MHTEGHSNASGVDSSDGANVAKLEKKASFKSSSLDKRGVCSFSCAFGVRGFFFLCVFVSAELRMYTCALGGEQSEINNCEGIARVHNHYLRTPLCCRGLISRGADGERASRGADQPGTLAHTFLLADPRSEHAHGGTVLVSYYRRSLGSFCALHVSDGPWVPAEGPHRSTVAL